MKLVTPAPPCGGLDSSDSLVTFVVLESGTCQIPVVTSSLRHQISPRILDDDDYMSDVYSYPLHDEERFLCDERTMNMRVDIKMKIGPGTAEAGTIYPTKLSFGGSIAPPSTPTDSMILRANMAPSDEQYRSHECDVIESNYEDYSRIRKPTLRNRSAPPVTSQYRTRLSNTSQWIKKRAVAELTSARNSARRPATSVRPFSERDNAEAAQISKIVLEPTHQSQTAMPDMGSFKGKPPITIIRRPPSIRPPKNASGKELGHSTQRTESRIDHSTEKAENNKVDQYVSELRKTIKMRKSGLNGRRKMTPFAVWAISTTEITAVSPDLEKFENETRPHENFIETSLPLNQSQLAKATESHAVRKEVIRQITVPEHDEPRPRRKLEVKGDSPPKAGLNTEPTSITHNAFQRKTEATGATHNAFHLRTEATSFTHNALLNHRIDATPTTHNALAHKTEATATTHNAFPRSRTNLSSAAKRGTKRYTRQFLNKHNPSSVTPNLLEKDIFQPQNGFLPNFDKSGDNSRTLPYIKLQQSVTDYKTYKQNSSPFVRTLI